MFDVIKYLVAVALLGTIIYARVLYLEYKATREKLKTAQEKIEELEKELKKAQTLIKWCRMIHLNKGGDAEKGERTKG